MVFLSEKRSTGNGRIPSCRLPSLLSKLQNYACPGAEQIGQQVPDTAAEGVSGPKSKHSASLTTEVVNNILLEVQYQGCFSLQCVRSQTATPEAVTPLATASLPLACTLPEVRCWPEP